MIEGFSVGYWAQTGSSSDHNVMLLVGCWGWRVLGGWSLMVNSFEFCSIYFLSSLV